MEVKAEVDWERVTAEPAMLVVFRCVAMNRPLPQGSTGLESLHRMALALFEREPARFRSEWRAEEKAYREAMAKLQPMGEGVKSPETPKGADLAGESEMRAEELIERLLKEAGDGSERSGSDGGDPV